MTTASARMASLNEVYASEAAQRERAGGSESANVGDSLLTPLIERIQRLAADRGADWRAALARTEGWLQRLWADSARLQRQRAALRSLRGSTLDPALPALGSTLAQLRAGRAARLGR